MEGTIRGRIPVGTRDFSLTKLPDRLSGTSMGTGLSGLVVNLSTHLRLVPRLGVGGDIPLHSLCAFMA